MSRIKSYLDNLGEQGKKALIPYITAGDPHPQHTVSLMHALVEAGADIIELGVPFSDPMADGPVIQLACERALVHGTSLSQVLEMVAEFRNTNQSTPIVLMGYLNPVEAMGVENFIQRAKQAGLDGVLIVDLPAEEAASYVPALRREGLDCIFLIAPTTTDERIQTAVTYASGYIYYVSFKGVTGANSLDVQDVSNHLQRIRAKTDMPVGVGFGIKDAESAAAVSAVADGVIVGSALVNTIASNAEEPATMLDEIGRIARGMREAMDAKSAR